MHRTKRHAAAALVAASLCAPATQAVDGAGNYAIWGQGARSCFQFVKAEGSDDATRFRDYVMGYLTAYNMLSTDTYSVTADQPLTQIMARLAMHCEDNQLDSFDRALKIFVEQQFVDRKKTPSGNAQTWGRAPDKSEGQ